MDEITLIIADDHPIVRQGLRAVIDEDTRFTVVGDACNGREAIELIEQHLPRLAILDLDMPVMSGFDAAREIKRREMPTEIVFLTMHRDEDIFNEAIDIGAKGYVLKDSALVDIIDCLEAIAAGKHYASHAMTSFLVERAQRPLAAPKPQAIDDLTPTELRVLKLIGENLTTREIGERLFISPRTVEKHRENICQKLDLHGSHSLLKFAITQKN